MTSVDNKVVSIKLDNGQFKQGMTESLSILDKLKKALSFGKEKSEIDGLEKAGSKFSLKNMADAVDGLSPKWLALGTIAVTTLANITNRAVDAGLRIAKALTVAPVMDGFREYEQNMNSIQTILANTQSKGETLQTVSAALDELNNYADKTIYNFAEMTRNIGTFTAAGVGLDTSVQAIKGFSNVAATAGAGATETAGAMYQLSQAMSSGVVKLQDWMSLEKAGLATEVFRDSLMETARVHGIAIDDMVARNGTFRLSLAEGWLSADIMTETLAKFTGDLTDAQLKQMGYTDEQIKGIQAMAQTALDAATKVKTFTQLVDTTKEAIGTGWATSFKIVVGDFEDARQLFTSLSTVINTVIGNVSDARNALLQSWADLGGRTALVQSLFNIITALVYAIKPVAEAFRELFPRKTGEDLFNMTKGLERFTEIIRDGVVRNGQILHDVFYAIFAVFRIAVNVVTGVLGVFKSLGAVVFTLIGSFSGVASSGAGMLAWLGKAATYGDVVRVVLDFVASAILKLVPVVANLGSIFNTSFTWISDKAQELYSVIARFIPQIRSGLIDGFTSLKDVVSGLTGGIGGLSLSFDFLSGAGDKVSGVMSYLKGLLSDVGGFLAGAASGLGAGVSNVGDQVASGFTAVLDFIRGIGTSISDAISSVWDAIKTGFSAIFSPEMGEKVASGVRVGFYAAILNILNNFSKNGFSLDLLGIGDAAEQLSEVFEQFGDTLKAFTLKVKADALRTIAISVGILAASIAALAFIPAEKLGVSLGILAGGLGALAGTLKVLVSSTSDVSGKQITAMAASMLLLGVAVLALSVSIAILAFIPLENLARGMGAAAAGILALGVAVKFMSDDTRAMGKASLAIIALGIALLPLTLAVAILGRMSFGSLAQGLGAVAVALAGFVLASNYIDADSMTKLGINFLLFSAGLLAMHKAVEGFAEMDFWTLVQGFIGLSATLGIMVLAMREIPDDMMEKSLGILAMSAMLLTLGAAVQTIGSLPFGAVVQGVAAITGVLATFIIMVKAMEKHQGNFAVILSMAVAIGAIAASLNVLGQLSIGQIVASLLAIAGALVIFGVAAYVLSPVSGALLAVGVGIAAFGLAVAAVGAGVYLFAAGLERMGEASASAFANVREMLMMFISLVPDLMGALGRGIVDMVGEILGGLPDLLGKVGEIVGQVITIIIELLPKAFELLRTFLSGVLALIVELAPEFATAALDLITALATSLRDSMYTLTILGGEIIVEFLGGVRDSIPSVGEAALQVIEAFVSWFGEDGNVSRFIDAGVTMLVTVIEGITNSVDRIIPAVTLLIVTFLNRLAQSAGMFIKAGLNLVLAVLQGLGGASVQIITTVFGIITKLIVAIGNGAGRVIEAGTTTALKFLSGLVSNTINFIDKGWALLLKLLNGIERAVNKYSGETGAAMGRVAAALINGIIDGLSNFGSEVWNRALKPQLTGLVGKVTGFFGINSPSKLFASYGMSLQEGFVDGIRKDAHKPVAAAVASAKEIDSAFRGIVENIDLGAFSDINPVITPVLDLSNVQRDAAGIDAMLASSTIGGGAALVMADRLIAAELDNNPPDSDDRRAESKDVTFIQNNYSPKSLTPEEVYLNTKSQLALAKKELGLE